MGRAQERMEVQPERGSPAHGVREEHHGSPAEPFLSLPARAGSLHIALDPGAKLGRFTTRRRLGGGSLGDVYLALDELRGHEVAIKVVNVGPHAQAGLAERLQAERAAYDRIQDHRHVLKVYDIHPIAFGGASLLVLSMEYADGGSLRNWLDQHREDLDIRRVQGLEYFKQICHGLSACHAVGVAHLDIKLENVLFVGDTLKLADFSIAAVVRDITLTGMGGERAAPNGAGLGTPTYMSPEHFTAAHPNELDPRSDIYSMGVLCYEVLHPRALPPFRGDFAHLRSLHLSAPPPPLPEAGEDVSRVISRCLEKDPSRRYGTAQELLSAIESPAVPETEEPAAARAGAAWALACHRLAEGRLPEAARACDKALEVSPDHEDAAEMREQLRERYQQAEAIYVDMAAGFDARSMEELCTLLVRAVNTYPDHPSGQVIRTRLLLRSRRYRLAMESGFHAAGRRDWGAALSLFRTARELNPGALRPEALARFAERVVQHVSDAREAIREAVEARLWRRALSLARKLDEYLDEMGHARRPNDEERGR